MLQACGWINVIHELNPGRSAAMQVTSYTDINALLDSLLMHMQNILRQKLVGVYLYGSLVSGDFDHESSDIDVLAVTSSDINDKEFVDLQKMHNDLIAN